MRRLLAGLLVAAPLLAGCSAARWIAGAPPAGAGAPATAPATPGRASRGGAALLARRCANCHTAPDPGSMSAGAWTAALERMKLRMRLPESEWTALAAMAGRRPASP